MLGVVLLFGATLVYSAPGLVLSAPPPPCSVPHAALHPRLVGKAAQEDREQKQVGGVTHQPLAVPQSGLPKVPGWTPARG